VSFVQDLIDFHRESGEPISEKAAHLEGHAPHCEAGDMLREVKKIVAQQGNGQKALRLNLMVEELAEYCEASFAGDLVEEFDALLDLLYVTVGTLVSHGFPVHLGWDEVHHSNMRKVAGVDLPKRDENGKVMKPDRWTPPNLEALLLDQYSEPHERQQRALPFVEAEVVDELPSERREGPPFVDESFLPTERTEAERQQAIEDMTDDLGQETDPLDRGRGFHKF